MFPRRNKKPKLDAIVPSQIIKGRNGEIYQADNIITDGNKVLHSMTLERIDKAKRPEGMSPRQFRNMVKSQRRLEKRRREKRLEAARAVDETTEHTSPDVVEALEAAKAPVVPVLWPWRRTS